MRGKAFLPLMLLLPLIIALASTTSIVTATPDVSENYAGAVGTNNFNDSSNAVGSDNATYANYFDTGHDGFWKTFGFNIPSDATIDGIKVEYRRTWANDPPNANTPGINIGKNESTLATEKTDTALSGESGETPAIASFGGASDLWGLSWSFTDINSANFTVRFRNTDSAEFEWRIYWIRVTIYYTPSSPEWQEVETWTNRINHKWYEIEIWTNYIDITLEWHEVAVWTNSMDVAATLYEHYDETVDWSDQVFDSSWKAQTFTVGENGHSVMSIDIKAYRVGSPENLTVSIRATDENEHPIGADLTTGTVDANSFTTSSSGDWYKIDVPDYSLTRETKYALVIRAVQGDANNYVRWLGHSTGSYTSGNLETSYNSGSSWSSQTDYDMMFKIWGADILEWCEAETWTNNLSAKEWHEVGTWTSYIESVPANFIGYDEIGSNGANFVNRIFGSKFSSSINQRIDNITVYVNVFFTGRDANIRCAIYDENINLVSQSDNLNVATDGWKTLVFSVPPVLSASKDYYFAAWDNGTAAGMQYDSGYSEQGITWEQTYDENFPDTLRPPDDYDNRKFSIYTYGIESSAPVLPTSPVLNTPDNNENIIDTETPTFTWFQSDNENYYTLLVDVNPPDWKNLFIWEKITDNFHTPSFDMLDGSYSWKIYAVNDNGRSESSTRTFTISADAHVNTENATNTSSTTATLNATISSYGKYDNIEGMFEYKPYRSLVWGENWFLADHYYSIPTDPATAGNWDSRTPVITVAALDSDEYGTADYNCDGFDDDNTIQDAIDNAWHQGGGKVYLYDGHYYTGATQTENYEQIRLRSNVTLMGENVDNTFVIDNAGSEPSSRMFVLSGQNILVENITTIGQGRSVDREMSAFHVNVVSGDTFARNIVIRNNVAENFASMGVYSETSYIGNPDNIWIINNTVRETGNLGIGVVVNSHVYVDNNIMINCGLGTPTKYGMGPAILAWSITNSAIVNNVMENSGADGMFVSTYSDAYACSDIVIRGNLIVNCAKEQDDRYGIIFGGSSTNILENIIIRGNKIVDNLIDNMKYGIYFISSYAENFIIENNNLVMTWEPIVINGYGHIVENNVGLYQQTNWNTIASPASPFDKNVENMQQNWTYQYRARIRTPDNETGDGGVVTFQLFGWVVVAIWTNYAETPQWWEVEAWTNYIDASTITWNEVETWTNYIHVLNWYEVETWVNYVSASTWYEVATWTNYMDSTPVGWWEVETWTNYMDTELPGWYEVGTWTNYLDATPPEWQEVAEWSNYLEVGLGKPTLISPENGSITYDDIPIFYWENGAFADDHWFVLDDDVDFSSPRENLIVQTETYTIPEENPLPYDNYWWKVIAENATAEKESDIWTFELRYQKPPPPEEFAWGAFMIRFLAVIGPFGIIAWKFTKIKDPVTGARAAMWAMIGFVAFVVLWFVADAVEAVLYAM